MATVRRYTSAVSHCVPYALDIVNSLDAIPAMCKLRRGGRARDLTTRLIYRRSRGVGLGAVVAQRVALRTHDLRLLEARSISSFNRYGVRGGHQSSSRTCSAGKSIERRYSLSSTNSFDQILGYGCRAVPVVGILYQPYA